MKQRAKERWDNAYTFYLDGNTEGRQKYLDYFETEQEEYPENE